MISAILNVILIAVFFLVDTCTRFARRASLAVAAAVLPLAGCGTVEPRTIIKTIEVKVPGLPVPCRVKPVEKPAFALDAAKTSDKLYPKGRAALAELKQRQAYEEKLEAAVKSCQ